MTFSIPCDLDLLTQNSPAFFHPSIGTHCMRFGEHRPKTEADTRVNSVLLALTSVTLTFNLSWPKNYTALLGLQCSHLSNYHENPIKIEGCRAVTDRWTEYFANETDQHNCQNSKLCELIKRNHYCQIEIILFMPVVFFGV